MNGQLAGRPAGTQAFVFGHKGIITAEPRRQPVRRRSHRPAGLQDTFISDLQNNGVHYYIGGHDHMYNRALVASPDGKSSVQDIVCQSDASKFYIPYGSAGYAAAGRRCKRQGRVGNGATLTAADPTQTNDYIYDVLVGRRHDP